MKSATLSASSLMMLRCGASRCKLVRRRMSFIEIVYGAGSRPSAIETGSARHTCPAMAGITTVAAVARIAGDGKLKNRRAVGFLRRKAKEESASSRSSFAGKVVVRHHENLEEARATRSARASPPP